MISVLSQLCAKSGWADEDSNYESRSKLLTATLLTPIHLADTYEMAPALNRLSRAAQINACAMLPDLPTQFLGSRMAQA